MNGEETAGIKWRTTTDNACGNWPPNSLLRKTTTNLPLSSRSSTELLDGERLHSKGPGSGPPDV